MKAIVINPGNEKEFEFLNVLLKKLGYQYNVIAEEEKEDFALLNAMVKEQKGEYVSEDEIQKALGKR